MNHEQRKRLEELRQLGTFTRLDVEEYHELKKLEENEVPVSQVEETGSKVETVVIEAPKRRRKSN